MEAGARPAGRGAGAGRLWRPSFSLPPRAPHHPFLSPPARQSAVQGMVAPSAVVICFCRYTMTTTRSLRFPPIPSSPDCFQVCSLRGTILYSMHAFAPPSWDSSAHISLSPESSSKIASLQLDSLSLWDIGVISPNFCWKKSTKPFDNNNLWYCWIQWQLCSRAKG